MEQIVIEDVINIHPLDFGILLEKAAGDSDEVLDIYKHGETGLPDSYVEFQGKKYHQTVDVVLSQEAQDRFKDILPSV